MTSGEEGPEAGAPAHKDREELHEEELAAARFWESTLPGRPFRSSGIYAAAAS